MRKIIIFGDSTTVEYSEEAYPQQGWAYFLKDYIKKGIEIKNFAQGGASLKSFIYSPEYIKGVTTKNFEEHSKWESTILPTISAKDIVIFYWGGINDMLQSGCDAYRKKEGGAYVLDEQNTSRESYIWIGEGMGTHEFFTLRSEIMEMKDILRKMISQTKEKGAIPIIIKGTGMYYKVRGQDKEVVSVTREYADAVMDVANSCGDEIIDIGTELDKEFCTFGYEKTVQKYLLPISVIEKLRKEKGIHKSLPVVDDNVHYNYTGAARICHKIIEHALASGSALVEVIEA